MVRVLFPPATGAGGQQAPQRLPPTPEPTPIPYGGGNANPTLRRRESSQANANNNANNNAFYDLPPPDEESILTLVVSLFILRSRSWSVVLTYHDSCLEFGL